MVFDAYVVCAHSLLLATIDTDLPKALTIWAAENHRLKTGLHVVPRIQTNGSRIRDSEALYSNKGEAHSIFQKNAKANRFILFRHLPWNLEVMHNLGHKHGMRLLSMLQSQK